VVYGDIGTSPLYAIRECFREEYGLTANAANVYGVLSLVVWSLILVVSVKYLIFILRADNRGEGGVLALLALIIASSLAGRDTRPLELAVLIAVLITGSVALFIYGLELPYRLFPWS